MKAVKPRKLTLLLWLFALLPALARADDLLRLVQTGTPDQVQAELQTGADVNARNDIGWTVLMMAAWKNLNVGVIGALLQAGADVNARSNNGDTALIRAASANQNPDIISALLKAGAGINAQNKKGESALMLAASSNQNPQVLSVLLHAGADVTQENQRGNTPLDLAQNNQKLRNADVYQELLTATSAAAGGTTPDSVLFQLAQSGTLEDVQRAIHSGADVKAKDAHGETALMLAAQYNPDGRVVSALTQAGANLNEKNNDGLNAIMLAAKLSSVPDVIIALHEAGANANEKFSKQEYGGDSTVLMVAAQYNQHPQIISALVAAGADVNALAKQMYGYTTALIIAARYNQNPQVIAVLITAGADVRARNIYTPLMWAAQGNPSPGVVAELLRAGSDVNATDSSGDTALIFAARSNDSQGSPQIIQLLLQAGADPNIKNNKGETARMAADYNLNRAVAYALPGANAGGSSSQTSQGAGPSVGDVLGAVSSGLSVAGQITGNTTVQDLSTVTSDAQQLADAASAAASGADVEPPAQQRVQGSGGSGGYHKDWPHSGAVLALVNQFGGGGSTPPEVEGPDTQRNDLIKAAIVAAWGANKEGQKGNIRDAIRLSSMMHDDLQNAFNLLSYGAPITGETAGLIISEKELQSLAGE